MTGCTTMRRRRSQYWHSSSPWQLSIAVVSGWIILLVVNEEQHNNQPLMWRCWQVHPPFMCATVFFLHCAKRMENFTNCNIFLLIWILWHGRIGNWLHAYNKAWKIYCKKCIKPNGDDATINHFRGARHHCLLYVYKVYFLLYIAMHGSPNANIAET